MMRRFPFLLAAVLSASSAAAQPKEASVTDMEAASPFDIAVLLARSERSAGMVLNLPQAMEPALAEAIRRLMPNNPVGANAFRTFVHENSRAVRLMPVEAGRSGADVLRSYAEAHARDGYVASEGFRDVALLKQSRARGCASVLRRPVREHHASQYPDDIVSAVVNDATGAPIPPGAVGSCLPRYMSVSPRVVVESAPTLEDALNTIAAQVPGLVWMAVESADGHCALGLVRTSDNPQTACTVGLANISGRR